MKPKKRVSKLERLIFAYEDYIKLLVDEMKETFGIAIAHGYTSSRVEAGKVCREHIARVKKQAIAEAARLARQMDGSWK